MVLSPYLCPLCILSVSSLAWQSLLPIARNFLLLRKAALSCQLCAPVCARLSGPRHEQSHEYCHDRCPVILAYIFRHSRYQKCSPSLSTHAPRRPAQPHLSAVELHAAAPSSLDSLLKT